MTMTGTNFQLW